MPTFTNREIMEQVVPALRTISGVKLTPVTRLRILQIRRVLEPQTQMLNEVRNAALLNRAILKDGKLVMKMVRGENIVVFAPEPMENLVRQTAFAADMKEVLEQTFECDLTIDYGDFDEVVVTGDVLFDLGGLLLLPEPSEEEPEVSDAEG